MQEFSRGEARTVILTNVSEMIKLNMYIIVISIMFSSLYWSEAAPLPHCPIRLVKIIPTNQPSDAITASQQSWFTANILK